MEANNYLEYPYNIQILTMTKRLLILAIVFVLILPAYAYCQEVKVIKYSDLKNLIESPVSDLTLINFWATWCKPCVKEIPYFENIQNRYEGKGVRVILVSFDFVEDLKNKVEPFVKKKGLQSEVLLLDETDYDYIISDVSKEWSGAIPATLIINKTTGENTFYEKEFKEGELDLIIETQLKL